jgi:hypothetical protein
MHGISLLAHQGSWDEIALVGGPIIVFAGLLAVARRRAIDHAARAKSEPNPDGT